ncbi:MAG: tetratricopeptide repeat protein, partial [Gloeomargaritales cyanobacterium]
YVASTNYFVAQCCRKLGCLEEALECIIESIEHRTSVDVNRTMIGESYHLRGSIENDLGLFDDAIDSFTEALKMRRQTVGKHHINYAESLHKLGDALYHTGALEDAVTAYAKALVVRKSSFGMNHSDVGTTLYCLGNVSCELGNINEALRYYSEALRIRRLLSDKDNDRSYAKTLHSIGVCYKMMGDADGAIKAFTEAMWAAKDLNIQAPSPMCIVKRSEILFGQTKFLCVSKLAILPKIAVALVWARLVFLL